MRFVLCLVFVIFLLAQLPIVAADGLLKVTFFDVGTADAALVEGPAGEHILIDGGTVAGGKKVAAYLKARGIEALDVVIATHPHPDHIGGLVQIIREFEVKTLYDTGIGFECEEFHSYQKALREFGGITTIVCGRILVSLPSGVHLEFLNPKRRGKRLHPDCILARLRYKDASVMFAGDLDTVGEGVVLFDELPLRSQILKVGHHGASDSTCEAFLDAVAPRFAVITVATPNKYGRPHEAVLERLEKRNIQIIRTDECGNVTFISDGHAFGPPKCERKPKPGIGSR
ncbi:MBL fold metallo-hydrolase [bacterium]|nr:MBL fold metallo-hydrolase [bacterium]